MLSVRLSKTLEERLDRLSSKAQRPKSYYVKKAIERYLNEEEEKEWALQAYKEFLDSGKKTYSLEEIKKLHELA